VNYPCGTILPGVMPIDKMNEGKGSATVQRLDAMLIEIETSLAKAREAKDQLEADCAGGGSHFGYELPQEALESYLAQAEQLLEIVLEAAEFRETRSRLIEKWASFEKQGIGKVRFLPEVDYLESIPLTYLRNVIQGVRIARGHQRSSWETYDLAKFESVLRSTAVLLRRRKIAPKNEREIRDVMHDYLRALFTEYTKSVQISGVICSFKPDGGVRNLKAAVEFKYVSTHAEVSTALRGIEEDVSGYKSADWVQLYSVIYQTKPFETEERLRAELQRVQAFTWTPILVTGESSRRKKRSRQTSKAK
jgi:hypothetical protein